LHADTRPLLVLAVPEADVHLYPGHQFVRVATRSSAAALQQLTRSPSLLVIDWDLLDGVAADLCSAAVAAHAAVLVTSSDPACAPRAIKAGCHGILLKPFPSMLVAARLGRLMREQAVRARFPARRDGIDRGTHRVCKEIDCPYCATPAPTSFEFSSHRRAWYACLSCDKVWLGARLE
jgi:DNA-binding response OmpR family regulator